jgi:phosphate transport system substrate-binding protein
MWLTAFQGRFAVAWAVSFIGLVACANRETRDLPPVHGVGATFPAPLYQRWTNRYAAESGARVTYSAVGSTRGIEAIMTDTADFGSSDAPLNDDQLEQAGDVLHVPITLGAVAVVYNLPGAPEELRLSGDVAADLFLGVIARWNDPKIVALNPTESLRDEAVQVVYRKEGSGTTALLTEYLTKLSPAWAERVGTGQTVKWPVGTSANGNEGVAQYVRGTPGAIGYVALAYARTLRLNTAVLRNRSGQFVAPSLDSTTAAATNVKARMPNDLRVSIVDVEGDRSYPIVGFSYALLRKEAPDSKKRYALARFLWWALHDGQSHAPFMHYASLPPEVIERGEAQLKALTSDGRSVLKF